jgi:hypothetical protein
MEAGQIKLAEVFKDLGPIPLPMPSDTELTKLWATFYGDDAKGFTFRTDGDPMPIEMREDIEQRQREFSLEQQADFHQGVADVTRMMGGQNAGTTTTSQYQFMLIFWKAIERLPSFEVFFNIMTKVFGQNLIGNDPKRLRQICHRVGKRFRRPGRPPKLPQAS